MRLGVLGPCLALALAGCGGDPNLAKLERACETTSNLGPEICSCVARKAKAELSEDAFAFLAASMAGEAEAAAALQGRLTPTDGLEAGLFMTRAPQECVVEN